MIQPPCVVPSNAPPLHDRSQSTSTTTVLQELPGNHQPNPYSYAPPLDLKFPRPLLENAYPVIPNPSTYPQHNRSIRPPVEQHGQYRSDDGLTIQEKFLIEHDAKLLYKRFLDSHQYSKYRQKQPKDVKNKNDQKWSDELERAFFYALVRWQPMGRRKHDWKAKLRGRNELIADAIQERTGIGRTRKQVSSHIQVLKPFVENDPFIMRYLSKVDSRHGDRGPRVPGYTDGRQRSQFHVASAGLGTRQGPTRSSGRRVNDGPQPYTDPDAFVPVEFEMFVQRKHTPPGSATEVIDRLHTYTQQVSQPMGPPYHIPNSETLLREYPMLASMHWDRKSTHHIIAAEASLAMAMRPMNGLTGVELGISFRCRSECFRPATQPGAVQVRCASQFFEGQTRFEDDSPPPVIEWHDVGGGMCEGQVKFGSNFWVKALSSGFKNAKERGKEYLEGITAVQDVYVVPAGAQPELILTIHWSFRLSAGECGRASWRRLIMPPVGSVYGLPMAKPEPTEQDAFDFNDLSGPLPALTTSTSMPPHPPTLQSPFPYESHSASTLSSATWPSNLSDLSTRSGLGIVGVTDTGAPQPYNNNDVDYLGGMMEFNFDPLALDGFDTSTFNFDATAGGGGADSFVADPSLDAYSQSQSELGYSQTQSQPQAHSWGETYAGAVYDAGTAYADQGTGSAGGYTGYNVYDPQMYGAGTQESQAYGGAGVDVGPDGGSIHDAAYSTQDMSGVPGQL